MEEEKNMDDEGMRVERVSSSPYTIPAAIIVAGALIAAALVYSNLSITSGSKTEQAAVVPPSSSPKAADLVDDDPFLGNPDAPVVIVEFGDYQCPFCSRFARTTEPEIIEKYVKIGKVKFVYRDFPLSGIHPEAQKSAEASECADEQGKFWEYHDLLYRRQAELALANYKKWAREIGLDAAQFDQCLDSGKYAAEVQKDFEDGQNANIQGTPGTFVGSRLVEGALPFPDFAKAIEEELQKNTQ